MNLNSDLIKNSFKELLDLKTEKNCFILKNNGYSEKDYLLIGFDFKNEVNTIKNCHFNDTVFYNSNYFEKLVFSPVKDIRDFDSMPSFHVPDNENGLRYKISDPSIEYIMACCIDLFKNNTCPSLFLANRPGSYAYDNTSEYAKKSFRRDFERHIRMGGRGFRRSKDGRMRRLITTSDNNKSYLFKSILKNVFRAKTMKIESKNDLSLDAFNKLSNSFLFSIGYNLNLPIMEFRYLKDQYKPIKREKSMEISSPKRIYNEKLLYYYQQGLSAENPVLQYLSFYQIIENFYYDVSNEDLIKDVKNTITAPDFSYKKNESIEKVIIKIRSWKFKEKQATKLVLEKFLKLDDLKNNLINYDNSYYDSIKKKGVKFAAAKKITESNGNIDVSSLSDRIYKVRNSLIHSKEGNLIFAEKEKGIYIPFTKHEEELRREIPLIRFVAEQIIINSSKELNGVNLNY